MVLVFWDLGFIAKNLYLTEKEIKYFNLSIHEMVYNKKIPIATIMKVFDYRDIPFTAYFMMEKEDFNEDFLEKMRQLSEYGLLKLANLRKFHSHMLLNTLMIMVFSLILKVLTFQKWIKRKIGIGNA